MNEQPGSQRAVGAALAAHLVARPPAGVVSVYLLSPGEAQQWHAAMAQARAQGSFVLAVPHHCAVGTRP